MTFARVFVDPRVREQELRRVRAEHPKHANAAEKLDYSLVKDTSVEGNINTLADDRARRALGEGREGQDVVVSPERLRTKAEKRTQSWGAFARWASSSLLLLAVLGTFAGIRIALPDLIAAAAPNATGATGALAAPLRAVAEAFGANAVALVGSIALGLLSHGMGQGRRQLLERLEAVSNEYIYPAATSRDDAKPLVRAVNALGKSSAKIGDLVPTMTMMARNFQGVGDELKSSLSTLGDRIAEITEENKEDVEKRAQQTLDTIQSRISELAGAVAGNANMYAGIIDTVRDRSDNARQAIESMQAANKSLATGLGKISDSITAVSDSATRINTASVSLATVSDVVKEQLEKVQEAVKGIVPVADRFDESLQRAIERVTAQRREDMARWTDSLQETNRQLAAIHEELASAAQRPSVAQLSSLDRNLLRRSSEARSVPESALSDWRSLGFVAGFALIVILLLLSAS